MLGRGGYIQIQSEIMSFNESTRDIYDKTRHEFSIIHQTIHTDREKNPMD